jgi:hypothetical protein
MKKTLFVIILIFIAAYSFAEFQIGPYASYKYPIFKDELPALNTIGIEDFWFGADARLKLSIFQGTAQALYLPGVADTLPNSIALNLSAGVAFDLLFIRLGLGVGPSFLISMGEDITSANMGMLGRVNVDLMFGFIALSLSVGTQLNFTGEGEIFNYNNFSFYTGLSVLFKLGGGAKKQA